MADPGGADVPDSQQADGLRGLRRAAGRLLALPILVATGWYALVYAHFVGYFERLGARVHVLEFSPTEHGFAAIACYLLLWHGTLAFVGLRGGAACVASQRTAAERRPLGDRAEAWLGGLLAIGFVVNLVLWLAYGGSSSRTAAFVGMVGGGLAHLATKLRSPDLRLWAYGTFVLGTVVFAVYLGWIDAGISLRNRRFPTVRFQVVGERDPRSGCLIGRNGGRYLFLDYDIGAGGDSHKVVRFIPESTIAWLEIRYLAEPGGDGPRKD